MPDLTGKIAVVTGGAQGIGEATATALHEAGATVVIADVRKDAATAAAARLANAVGLALDVTDSASVRAVVDSVVADLGRLDIWVNNAGIAEGATTLEMTDEVWQRTIDINLTGTFFGAREAGRHMCANGGGVIINISSIAAFRAVRPERHVAYDVSKAAVAHMVKVLAAEWVTQGVRVNAVAPGYADTPLLAKVGSESPEVMADWLTQIPQQRLIRPSEIGAVIAFLASDAASSITGQVIHADAGYTCW